MRTTWIRIESECVTSRRVQVVDRYVVLGKSFVVVVVCVCVVKMKEECVWFGNELQGENEERRVWVTVHPNLTHINL